MRGYPDEYVRARDGLPATKHKDPASVLAFWSSRQHDCCIDVDDLVGRIVSKLKELR